VGLFIFKLYLIRNGFQNGFARLSLLEDPFGGVLSKGPAALFLIKNFFSSCPYFRTKPQALNFFRKIFLVVVLILGNKKRGFKSGETPNFSTPPANEDLIINKYHNLWD
jgi:hypothetical protein